MRKNQLKVNSALLKTSLPHKTRLILSSPRQALNGALKFSRVFRRIMRSIEFPMQIRTKFVRAFKGISRFCPRITKKTSKSETRTQTKLSQDVIRRRRRMIKGMNKHISPPKEDENFSPYQKPSFIHLVLEC